MKRTPSCLTFLLQTVMLIIEFNRPPVKDTRLRA